MPRILIVEDVWIIAAGLQSDLERLGFEVVGPEASVEGGLRAATVELLDGAILDINLDGRNVEPVAHALDGRGVPFVFVTGYDEPSQIPPAFRDRPILRKPLVLSRLMPVLRRELQAARTP